MDFNQMSDLFMRYVIRYHDKSLEDIYNAFAKLLFQKYGITEIPYPGELLKIAIGLRSYSKEECEKIYSSKS